MLRRKKAIRATTDRINDSVLRGSGTKTCMGIHKANQERETREKARQLVFHKKSRTLLSSSAPLMSTLTLMVFALFSNVQAFQSDFIFTSSLSNKQLQHRSSNLSELRNHDQAKNTALFAPYSSPIRGSFASSQGYRRSMLRPKLHKHVVTSLSMKNDEAVTSSTTTSNTSGSSISSSSKNTDDFDERIYQTAIKRTLLTVAAATLFGFSILHWMGSEASEEFFAGYIVEQSLSVDNLFVFLLLFDYFQVPIQYQNRVLNYGIIGAVIMRALAIGLGSAVLHRFKPVLLVFAAVLLSSSVTAISEFISGDEDGEEEDMSDNAIVKFSRSLFPTTEKFDEDRFFTDADGGIKKATPLLLCLVAVEISDIVFAVDSIPAVFGVTEVRSSVNCNIFSVESVHLNLTPFSSHYQDSFIVFTSNMFAILGLRSLYTVLSKAATDLEYLEPAVAVVLGFIGSKMIGEYFGYLIPTSTALIVVASLLSAGIGASLAKLNTEKSD